MAALSASPFYPPAVTRPQQSLGLWGQAVRAVSAGKKGKALAAGVRPEVGLGPREEVGLLRQVLASLSRRLFPRAWPGVRGDTPPAVSSGRDTQAGLVSRRGRCGVSQTSVAGVHRAPLPGAGVRRSNRYLELGPGMRISLGTRTVS